MVAKVVVASAVLAGIASLIFHSVEHLGSAWVYTPCVLKERGTESFVAEKIGGLLTERKRESPSFVVIKGRVYETRWGATSLKKAGEVCRCYVELGGITGRVIYVGYAGSDDMHISIDAPSPEQEGK